MCDPVTLTTLAIATTGYSVFQSNAAAREQFRAQAKQAEQAVEEKQVAATEELGARMKERRKIRARARVAGGESGAQGQSFSVSLNQMLQDADEEAALIGKNLSLGQRQVMTDLASAQASVRTISGLEAGLQIAAAGASAYASGSKAEQTTTGEP